MNQRHDFGSASGPERLGWRRAAVAYWWLMLLLSVAVSAYGNVLHAGLTAPTERLAEARWIAGALPVVLVLMVEGIAIGVRGGVAGWLRRAATVFVALLGAVVLASSYVGLLSLVESTRLFGVAALNYGLAGVPDLLMIASTVYVMALRTPATGRAPASAPSTWSRIGGGLLARVGGAVVPTPESPTLAAVESVDGPDEQADEFVGHVDDQPRTNSSGKPVRVVDDWLPAPTSHTDERPDELVDDSDRRSTNSSSETRRFVDRAVRGDERLDTRVSTSTHRVDDDHSERGTERGAPDKLVDTVEAQLVDAARSDGELVGQPDGLDELGDEQWRVRADQLVATTRISAGVDELATVLALDGQGESKQAIADRIGRSRSTVAGWLKAAEGPEKEGQPRPALAVVNN